MTGRAAPAWRETNLLSALATLGVPHVWAINGTAAFAPVANVSVAKRDTLGIDEQRSNR